MSYWILPVSGLPISCTTIQRVTNIEKASDTFKARAKKYEQVLEGKWMAYTSDALKQSKGKPTLCFEDEDDEFKQEYKRVINNKDIHEVKDLNAEEIGVKDPYIGMELGMPSGAKDMLHATAVKKRAVGEDGRPIGVKHNNSLLDSRAYEIEFMNGHLETVTANVIAENLLAQVDDKGHRHLLIDEIEDYRKTDEAVEKQDGTYVTNAGMRCHKRTTKGNPLSNFGVLNPYRTLNKCCGSFKKDFAN